MERIEKTVFLSYRRTNVPWALALFQNLTFHGYDVFFDFTGIASGDFENVILQHIKARAHFIVFLTPSALERCSEPRDWLRREIETALEVRRNIVPLMLEGFDFGTPEIASQLTGKLAKLNNYNALRVPAEYFGEAMERLRTKYLNVPINMVLHPISRSADEAAKEEQAAAANVSVVSHVDEVYVPRVLVNPPEDEPRRIVRRIQPTMEERLTACKNDEACRFFKQRSHMATNSRKNALVYLQAGKIHWYVWPTPAGAAVLQIDRFEGDERTWGNLSNPNRKRQTYVGKANLRFDLMSSSDFEFFSQIVEKESASTLHWMKPQGKSIFNNRLNVQTLIDAGLLKIDETIYLKAELPDGVYFREDDPMFQAVITGKSGKSNAVRWKKDDQEYSISRLAWTVFKELRPEKKEIAFVNGKRHWVNSNGRSLLDLERDILNRSAVDQVSV